MQDATRHVAKYTALREGGIDKQNDVNKKLDNIVDSGNCNYTARVS